MKYTKRIHKKRPDQFSAHNVRKLSTQERLERIEKVLGLIEKKKERR